MRSIFFFAAVTAASLFALPSGHKVQHGKIQVTQQEKNLVIQSGKRAVVNWDKFSVDKGEKVHFQMKNSKSSVLNRVTGGVRSDILGKLESNGNVYLLNGKGVLIGKDAQINVNSLVASTLDVLDEEFLRGGELRFFGDEKGSIVNMGNIEGHSVFLLASDIENHGTIQAERVGLATGSKILLRPEGEQRIFIEASNSEETIDNRGKITALTTEIKSASPYVLAIRTSGVIEATGKEERDGKIFLVAEKGTAEINGTLHAKNVEVSGREVYLYEEAKIVAPEGNVFLGGDPQNLTDGLVSANKLFAYPGSVVDVSAVTHGDGGNVYIWADNSVNYYGEVFARGGSISGNGGFVELSSNEPLGWDSFFDFSAPNGQQGKLLLDPQFAIIDSLGGDPATGQTFSFPSSTATQTISANSIVLALLSADVEIQCGTDCTIRDNITSGTTNNLTFTCGRSCIMDPGTAVVLLGGDFIVTINDAGATVRDPGVAEWDVGVGSAIFTTGGNITQSVGTYGGIQEGIVNINGSFLVGDGGNISLTGVNALIPAAANNNYGVSLDSSSITTTGAGTISLTGTGSGGGGNENHGVEVQSSTLSVDSGLLSIDGTGIATGVRNRGIRTDSTNITSTSSLGSSSGISITGTGGSGTSFNRGVVLDTGTAVTTSAGPISITGNGGVAATGNQNLGIYHNLGTITSTTGTITLIGQGGGGNTNNRGIDISGGITSEQGAISITGTGGGTAAGIRSQGVSIPQASGFISSTGTVKATAATITINGTGGVGSAFIDGINARSGSSITSVAGDILLTGAASSNSGSGIFIGVTASIASTGTGSNAANVTLLGTSPLAPGVGLDGVTLNPGTSVTTVDGNISITGEGLAGTAFGIELRGTTVQSTGSGAVDLTGTGFGGLNNSFGIIAEANSLIEALDGDLTLVGQGGITATGDSSIGINLDNSTVRIGAAGGGNISITGTAGGGVNSSSGISLLNGADVEALTGNIIMVGNQGTATGTNCNGVNIESSSSVAISTATNGGTINITGRGSDTGLNSANGVRIADAAISALSGEIVINGRGGDTSGDENSGIEILSNSTITASGTALITLIGTGGDGTSNCTGISFDSSSIISGVGDVTLRGTSGGGSTIQNRGINYTDNSLLTSADGAVLFDGVGGSGTDDNVGVIYGAGAAITVDDGSLTIIGTSSGTGSSSQGVSISNNTLISSTSTAPISVTGTASTAGTDFAIGVVLSTAPSTITSNSGKITVTGIGGGDGTGTFAAGVGVSFGAMIEGTSSAEVEVTGFGGDAVFAGGGVILVDGGVISTESGLLTIDGTGSSTPTTNSFGILGTLFGGSGGIITSESGFMDITGRAGPTGDLGILLEFGSTIGTTASSEMLIKTRSDLILSSGGQIIGGSSLLTVDVDRDINITGDAGAAGIIPKTGGVTISAGRDITLSSIGTGSAHIGDNAVAGITSDITFTRVGRNVSVSAVTSSASSTLGASIIGHAFEGGSGDITFSDVLGNVTVKGADVGGGVLNGFGQIGHSGPGTLNGNIELNVRGSVSVTGGLAIGAMADGRIGHSGGTTTSSLMTIIAGNNITMTSQAGAGQAIINNPSATGALRLVVDNRFPSLPGFGTGSFSLGAGSDLSTGGGELRIYTVDPTLNSVNELINGAPFVATPFGVNDANNEYDVYFAGGTFAGGSAFRVYYKIGTALKEAILAPFISRSFYLLQVAEAELQDRLPVLRDIWHHPSFSDNLVDLDPGFDPYYSFIFEDNVYWMVNKKIL